MTVGGRLGKKVSDREPSRVLSPISRRRFRDRISGEKKSSETLWLKVKEGDFCVQ